MKGNLRKDNSKPSSRAIAQDIAQLADDKKAEDIVILDMRKVANFCDYFVICSGNTDRQVKAIADHIEGELLKKHIKVSLKQGLTNYTWVVFDTGDIVTHIFHKATREFYRLEYLWRDAKEVKWQKNKTH